jgi:bifunctional non-homologous end joining protein LigD
MAPLSPEALLRRLFPPMLATLTSSIPRDEQNWHFELKYDGYRAIAAVVNGEVLMWTRNAIELNTRFPEIARALAKIRVKDAVIDGEVAALDEKGAPRFQLLQRGSDRRTFFFAFDLIWLDGKDLRNEPLETRRALLEKIVSGAQANVVQLARQVKEPAKAALQDAAKRGYEGLIAKRRASKYETRRSKEWLKIKAVNAQEVAIVGFTPSTHSSRELGSLILGVVDDGKMRYAGRVGTGFSAKQRADLKRELEKDALLKTKVLNAPRTKGATWVEPRYVAQVRFTEWTSDGSMRHPSFLGLRPDKRPMDCVVEKPVEETRGRGDAETRRNEESMKAKTASGRRVASTRGSRVSKSPARAGASPRPRVPASPRQIEVALTNPDRMIYPRDKLTKQDVADYYEAVAEPMIRALDGRPLALEHWNQGIDKPSWFHHNVGPDAPGWMTTVETPLRTSKRSVRHPVVDRPETLRWLAQRSALTIHMWSSRVGSLESPDWVVFDLDPAKGKGIEQAVEAALVVRKLLDQMKITGVPKTSGKRGIHVFVPLIPGYSHEDAVEWACKVAEAVAAKVPSITVERSINKREGRLYFDCLQNGYGKTVVAPYSLRAIDGAPVSAPLKWEEITPKLDPKKFNLKTMPDRIAKVGDLFRPAIEGGVQLPRFR